MFRIVPVKRLAGLPLEHITIICSRSCGSSPYNHLEGIVPFHVEPVVAVGDDHSLSAVPFIVPCKKVLARIAGIDKLPVIAVVLILLQESQACVQGRLPSGHILVPVPGKMLLRRLTVQIRLF